MVLKCPKIILNFKTNPPKNLKYIYIDICPFQIV